MALIHLRTPIQSTAAKYAAMKAAAQSDDPKLAALMKAENANLIKLREVTPGAVQSTPFLTGMSLQYGNGAYIGEMLMPVTPVPQLSGEYPVYDERSRYNPPDDSMSGRSTPNEISDGRSLATYACKGYAFTDTLLVETMRNQMAPLNEMIDLQEAPAEVLALRREMRISTVMTTAANYPSTNKKTLSAGSRWTDPGGTPVQDILTAVASLWTGRGPSLKLGWTNLDVWNVVRAHPDLLVLMAADERGLVKPDAFCEYFGLDGMLISESRLDSANEGQTANYGRLWGNYFGVARVSPTAQVRNASFGYTMRWGSVEAQQWYDPRLGTLGAYVAKVSAHECHQVVANKTGYLLTTPT